MIELIKLSREDNFSYCFHTAKVMNLFYKCYTLEYISYIKSPSHLFQKRSHLSTAGFRCYPTASYFACLCRSRSEAKYSGARIVSHRYASIVLCLRVRRCLHGRTRTYCRGKRFGNLLWMWWLSLQNSREHILMN